MGYTKDTSGKPIYNSDITDPVGQFQAAVDYAQLVAKPVRKVAALSLNSNGYYKAMNGAYPPTVTIQAGRAFLDGTVTNTLAITFDAGATYTLGTVPVGFRPTADVYDQKRFRDTRAVITIQASTGAILFLIPEGITLTTAQVIFGLGGTSWPVALDA